jgi:peptide/nickel transport system substrate-binding protein
MKLRTVLLCLTLLAILALSVSLIAAQEEDASVTIVYSIAPGSLDPHTAASPSHPAVLPYIFDTLVHQDETGAIQPHLAESWEISDDGLTITFHLRDDVLFSNGNPVNADAVIYTFQRLQETGQRSFIYGDISRIEEFEKLDEYSVRFHLSEPTAPLFSVLSYIWAGILDPEATETAGEDFGRAPVGSGPYVVADWDAEDTITLTRNPNYHGHRPTDDPEKPSNIAEIKMRFTTDQTTRINALLTGEVDIASISSAPQLERIAGEEGFSVMDDPSRGLAIFGFNCGRAPFDNVLMRRAVAQAVDKQVILDIAAPGGLGVIVDSPIAPSIFGYNPDLEAEALPYDVDAARQLVEEAGYDGSTVTILTSNYPPQPTMATILQAQLAEIGVNAEIEVVDYAASRVQATAGEYDILVTRYNWNDPDLLRLYLSEASIGGPNYYFFANAELDALTAQGHSEFDPDTRYQIYTDAQRIVMDQMPWVPLYMPVNKVIVNTARLSGVELIHSFVVLDNTVAGE